MTRRRIARLLPPHYGPNTGWVADSFFAPGGADGPINSVVVLGDGSNVERFLVGGSFSNITGVTRLNLARLSGAQATASEDAFAPSPNGAVTSLYLQPDGKLLAAGSFTSFPGTQLRYIARLTPDGLIDPGFTTGDARWKLNITGLRYDGGAAFLELHASDGQHWPSQGDPESYLDSEIRVNGLPVLKNKLVNSCLTPCGANQSPPSDQIFGGHTVPYSDFSGTDDACCRNEVLWDIVRDIDLREALSSQTGGNQSFTLTSDDSGSDAVSLVAAILLLPHGAAPEQLRVPVERPASYVLARSDDFVVERHLGTRLLDVLGNDTSSADTLLALTSVSEPTAGKVEIVFNSSALAYVPDPNPDSDSTVTFTYTTIDQNGAQASGKVTIHVSGIFVPTELVSGLSLPGQLGGAGRRSLMRGGHQPANFYRFDAVKGDNVHFAIDQATVRTHAYLYDSLGRVVASSSHTGIGEASDGARFNCEGIGMAANEALDYWLPFGYGDLCLEATGYVPSGSCCSLFWRGR